MSFYPTKLNLNQRFKCFKHSSFYNAAIKILNFKTFNIILEIQILIISKLRTKIFKRKLKGKIKVIFLLFIFSAFLKYENCYNDRNCYAPN